MVMKIFGIAFSCVAIFVAMIAPTVAAEKDAIVIFTGKNYQTDKKRTLRYYSEDGEKIGSTVVKESLYVNFRDVFVKNQHTRPGDLLASAGLEWISYAGNGISFLDQQGTTATVPVQVLPSTISRQAEITAADVNNENFGNEILVCNVRYFTVKVRIYSYNEGENSVTLLSSFMPFGERKSTKWGCEDIEIGDVDGDGEKEIIILRQKHNTSRVKIFSLSGEEKQKFELDQTTETGFDSWRMIGVADVDGDEKDEIFVQPTAYSNFVYMLDGNGVLEYTWDSYLIGTVPPDEVKVGDVDGDGFAEIITRGTGRKCMIRVYDHLGTLEQEFQAFPNATLKYDRYLFVGPFDVS